MKKAFKFLFVAVLIALMAVTAVACGGNTGTGGVEATPTPTPGGTTGTTEVTNYTKPGETYTFSSWQYTSDQPYSGDDTRNQAMRERIAKLESDYQITIEFVKDSDAHLQSAFQGVPEITGGKEGGLHTMMKTYLYQNLTGQCLTALSDYSHVYDFRNEEKFNVYSQYDLCEYNDKLWFFIPVEIGVHFECGGNCLVFNKKLLQSAGYTADMIYGWVNDGTWTWDKFEEVLKKVTNKAEGIWGIERGNEALVMWSLANSNGTEFVTLETMDNGQKQDKFVYSGDKGERLMEAYDEFINLANGIQVMETTYYGSTSTEPLTHFLNGDVAFYYNGYSSNPLKDIAQAEFEYGLVPWPKGPSNVANENTYHSMYPHLNPYRVYRDVNGNTEGAVQILCQLYTPIYDANSQDAIDLYEMEKDTYTKNDAEAAKNLDIVESSKEHFRVFMYSSAPVTLTDGSSTVAAALFGKGEDAILKGEQNAATYFKSIAGAINKAITDRSPYSWK